MNMNKEIKAEIRTLNWARKKIQRDLRAADCIRRRQIRKLEREILRSQRSCGRAVGRIDKRIAILEGRLS